jgi:hypothetical protein
MQNLGQPDHHNHAALQRYFGNNAEQGGQGGAAGSQVEQANGVTRMMQQCTAMLRDRMGEETCTPLQTGTVRSEQLLSSRHASRSRGLLQHS